MPTAHGILCGLHNRELVEFMGNPGPDKSGRTMQVIPKLKMIITAELQREYDGL